MSVDTLSLARELRAAEIETSQAEAIAAAIGRAVVETSATKADLQHVEAVLRAEMQAVSVKIDAADARQGARTDVATSDLRTEIEKAKTYLLFWFIAMQVTVGGVVIAMIKLLPA